MLNAIGAVTILLFVLTNPLSLAAQEVLDTTGKPLQSGTRYYILPSSTNSGGGGVTLVSRNSPCPLFVGQENRTSSTGLPVVFTPFIANEKTIGESRDFTVRFSASTTCVQSTEWALESNPASTERTLLTTGRSSVYLRIDRDGNGYKLVFCPSNLCPTCRPRCGDVGVFVENGKRLLALYVPALPVVFKRA